MLKKIALIAVVSTVVLSGCATGMSPAGVGLITDVRGPISATSATGSKTGTACASTIIGLIIKGDASIAAAKDPKILDKTRRKRSNTYGPASRGTVRTAYAN